MDFLQILQDMSLSDKIMLGAVFALLPIAIILIKIYTKPKRKDPVKEQKKIKTKEQIYSILVNKRITRNYILSQVKKYGLLSVYTQSEIKCNVVDNFFFTVYGSGITFVIALLIFRELVASFLCVYGAFIILSVRADKNIEKATVRVYQEMKTFISSLRIEYKKSHGDILVALENATCGIRIARGVDAIKHVMTSPNKEEALQQFFQLMPFKQMQTLAMVCVNIYEHGDNPVGEDTSVFDETMLLMEADINQKLEEITYEKQLYYMPIPFFNALEWLAMLGVIMTIALKALMMKIMPATAAIYNSIVGLIIQDGIIAFSFYTYNKIARAHLQQVILQDDRSRLNVKLLKHNFIKKIAIAFAPKDQKRRVLDHKLKVAVSKNTVENFYLSKICWALAGFTLVFIMTVFSPSIERNFLRNFTKSFDLLADDSAYIDEKTGKRLYEDALILEMDNYYIYKKNNEDWILMDEYDMAEIRAMIKSYMPTLSDLQIEDQITRLEEKYKRLTKVKYHWWYIILAFAAGFLAYRVPNKKLNERLELALFEEEEEFLQLQMVTLILSSLNMDTFDTLGHLANIADFHKDELMKCYYTYASNPHDALQNLEDVIRSQNFKLFVGKLKETIEDLSVKDVFADLRNDRAHICSERDIFIKNNISRTKAKMGMMSLTPMKAALYGMMVFPLMYTGITGLLDAVDTIGSLN